jgi:excisionase family DNA binding protein
MGRRKAAPRQARIEGMSPEILDVEGAARLLGVSKRTIYSLAHEKVLPASKVGREWRFSRKRLIEWVTEGSRTPDPKGEPQSLEELLRSVSVRAARRE